MSARAIKKIRPFKKDDLVKLCLTSARWGPVDPQRLSELQGREGVVTNIDTTPNGTVIIYVKLPTEPTTYGFRKEDLAHVIYQIDEQP